jgi:hypothetical protein
VEKLLRDVEENERFQIGFEGPIFKKIPRDSDKNNAVVTDEMPTSDMPAGKRLALSYYVIVNTMG